jgi:leucyl aminopeptidase (aminopeptidase T)
LSSIETYRAAEKAVREVMGVRPGEQVLVVTDSYMPPSVGEALVSAAGNAGADAALITLTTRPSAMRKPGQEQPSHEPPPPVAAAMAEADVIYQLTHPILNGTEAETKALQNGARVLRMLLWDFYRHPTEMLVGQAEIEASFIRAHSVDIAELAETTRKVTQEVARAREIRITTEAGTDLRILHEPNLSDPPDYFAPKIWPNPIQCCDGICHDPGTWDESAGGNIGFIPVDAEGVYVADHSSPPFGLLREPIVFHVENRHLTKLEGGVEAQKLERWLAGYEDENVYNCPAEWGFGTHRCWIDSGNFLEHEKAYASIHVALGDDMRFGGGHLAPIHIDPVFFDARIELDGRLFMEGNEFLL